MTRALLRFAFQRHWLRRCIAATPSSTRRHPELLDADTPHVSAPPRRCDMRPHISMRIYFHCLPIKI